MTEMSAERLVVRSEDVAWREVGDEVVMLHLPTASYLSLNGSGRQLWLRLVDGASASDLSDELVRLYGLDPDRAAADAAAFLDSLRELNLLGPATS